MQELEPRALEVLSDDDGSVTLGWVAEGVYYARFAGGLSVALGMAHLSRLREALDLVRPLTYFVDASTLARYDLVARSAFIRFVLENRNDFTSIVMQPWSGGVTAATEAFVAAMGGSVTIIRDAREFDLRLLGAAPLAMLKLQARHRRAESSSSP
jgi:hypothetical protein